MLTSTNNESVRNYKLNTIHFLFSQRPAVSYFTGITIFIKLNHERFTSANFQHRLHSESTRKVTGAIQ